MLFIKSNLFSNLIIVSNNPDGTMIIAELKGKIPSKLEDKEDLLTSNVFSFFKYSDRILLKEYLGELGLNVTLAESQSAEFLFWLSYEDGTEPDLIVICGKYYILFEAKLYSDFAPKSASIESQIAREIKMGKMSAINENREFVYVAITAEYFKEHGKYTEYENKDFQFIWTNWQTIATLLENKLADADSIGDNGYASDLYSLLIQKKLRAYLGIKNISSHFNHQCPESVFYNVKSSKFKGEFSGFIESLNKFQRIESYSKFYTKSFFKNMNTTDINPTYKIISYGD